MDWIEDLTKQVEAGAAAPEGTSHSFAVEAERMVLPGPMVPVAVIARVCACRRWNQWKESARQGGWRG